MDSPDAQFEFDALISEVPDSSAAAARARKERARAFAKLRREEQAAERRREEQLVDLLIQQGLLRFQLGDYEGSISSHLRALELDPSQTVVREDLVAAYMRIEAYESAKDLLIDALRDNPEEVWAYISLALHYFKVESNFEMSKQLLTRALELDPDNAHAHNNLGALHLGEERFDEALAHFDQSILHQPGNPHPYSGRVMAYLAKNSLSEAEHALKLFVEKVDATDDEASQLLKEAKEALLRMKRHL